MIMPLRGHFPLDYAYFRIALCRLWDRISMDERIMRRITLSMLMLLLAAASLQAASGSIGVEAGYYRHYDGSLQHVESQEAVLGVSSATYFDDEGIFGLGVDAGYGFTFGQLAGFSAVHLGADALFRIGMNGYMAFVFSAGLRDSIYIFNGIATNEFGIGAGITLAFRPASYLGLDVSFGYDAPLASSYRGLIAGQSHIISCGLAITYAY